jgi:hypothetical protein
MQPERQIALACTGIAIALAAPEFLALTRHQPAAPGTGLVIAAVLGGLGIFGGCLMAAERETRTARGLAFGFWIALALGLSITLVVAAAQSPTWGHRALFAVAGLLPLVGPIMVLARRETA